VTSSPLAGRRIVVTRSRSQASELTQRLRDLGALVDEIPLIRIVAPVDNGQALEDAVRGLPSYQWVVLTSPNAAGRFVAAGGAESPVWARANRPRIGAVGPATARAVEAAGLPVDLMPDRHVADALVEAFPSGSGQVLFPAADKARSTVPQGLTERGWSVTRVTAYRTVPAPVSADQREAISGADMVTFTSSSTVEFFCQNFGADAAPEIVACIGPVTAATAEREGLTPAIVAATHTIAGLVEAVVHHAASHPRNSRP